jgi:hypothetical protein
VIHIAVIHQAQHCAQQIQLEVPQFLKRSHHCFVTFVTTTSILITEKRALCLRLSLLAHVNDLRLNARLWAMQLCECGSQVQEASALCKNDAFTENNKQLIWEAHPHCCNCLAGRYLGHKAQCTQPGNCFYHMRTAACHYY